MKKRPQVAILANYPLWVVDDTAQASSSHYAVWLTALSEAFRAQDQFDIHWVSLSPDVAQAKFIERYGQHFYFLPRARRMVGLCTAYWHDRRQIKKTLQKIQPDLVHAWGTEDCYGLAAQDAKHARKLFSVQGLISAYMRYGDVPRFHRWHRFYESRILSGFQHITAESPWACEQVGGLTVDADITQFDYAVESHFFEGERDLSPTPCCVFAGSDTLIKNVPQLIRLFARPELSHIELILSGFPHGRYHDLPANIKVAGRLDRQEMKQLYARAWCLVHPSLVDTGPTVVKEARVMGLPVVLTENCGSKQYITEGQSGYVVPPQDDDAFAQAILHICTSREQALSMGSYGRAWCREQLSSTMMLERLMSLYHRIL